MKKTLTTLLIALMAVAMACNRQAPNTTDPTTEELVEILSVKIHKHPKDAELYYSRAKLLMELQRTNDAIKDLIIATDIDSKEEKYQMLLGDAYFANGDVEHSYQTFQRIIEQNDNNTEAYLKLGEIAYYSRDYERAMTSLSKVTERDKSNRTALFMKAFIYKEIDDTAKAVTLLQKVCDLYPDYAPAFEELGLLYANRHNALALEYLATANRIEPTNTNVLYGIGMFYQETGNYNKAEETYKQLLDINPNHIDAWHNRGYLQLYTFQNTDLAIEYFGRALQIDNRDLAALTNRGCAYEAKGMHDLAKADFQAAVKIDPNFTPANEGLKRLGK